MRKPRGVLIAGNWKMNYGSAETSRFFAELTRLWNQGPLKQPVQGLRACLIPSFLALETAISQASAFAKTAKISPPLSIAAQNAHWETKGAFTGEVSGPMLAELGIRCVLVGHTERRQYFGESDATVRKRAESLLNQGFSVILCIGETLQERQSNQTDVVLIRQLEEIIPLKGPGLKAFLDGRLIIAYEPVWAIGIGLNASSDQVQEVHGKIRQLIQDRVPASKASELTSILYGGSVTPANVDELLSCTHVDGALVGGASLKPESFFALIQAGANALCKSG